jgi:hypothetical protein
MDCTSPIQWTLFEGSWLRRGIRFLPETPRDLQGVRPLAFPPRDFIAGNPQFEDLP